MKNDTQPDWEHYVGQDIDDDDDDDVKMKLSF